MRASRKSTVLFGVGALAFVTTGPLALAQSPHYTISAIVNPNSTGYTTGDGINSQGGIISSDGGGTKLYLGGSVISLTNFYIGGHGYSAALNDAGQAVGQTYYPGTFGGTLRHASLYSNGTVTDLGTLDSLSGAQSKALAINNARQVTGYSDVKTGGSHAFLYTLAADGTVATRRDTGSLGGSVAEGDDINDAGLVVGTGNLASDSSRYDAFSWQDGVMTDLGKNLPGSNSAYAVNGTGHAVGEGYYDTSDQAGFQALLFANGTVTPLYPGILNGSSQAFDINNSDMSVGEVFSGSSTAALWIGTNYYDLNTLIDPGSGWTLQSARGINDAGQIVGVGQFNGNNIGFLLTPVAAPEPSQIAALGLDVLGLSGLALKARSRPLKDAA